MPRAKKKPTEPQIRCAIYCRKSTEDGLDQDFNSLDAQREAGEAYILSQKHEGWTCIPTRYDDGGFSGGNVDRPGVQQLLTDIDAGKIDCVIVYKVDRLSRSLLDFARMMTTFEAHDVSFVSATQQFNTSHSMGRLMLNILLSFAQFEREVTGERIRDKIAAQRRKGKWAGGTPVLGYDVDRTNPSPKLVVNAEEAAGVREIFNLYHEHGSLLPVVDELEKRGWSNKAWRTKKDKAKGGGSFDRGSLYALLTNPIYVGKIKHKDELFDGEHEPIVDTTVFEQVGKRLSRNGANGGTEVRNRHGALLKGILKCKSCDLTMVHTFTSAGTTRYRYYACTKAIKRGRKACPSRSLPAGEIEKTVVDEIRCIVRDKALRAEIVRQSQKSSDKKLKLLRREQGDLKRELGRHNAELRGNATRASQGVDVAAQTADLRERIARAERRLSEIEAETTRVEQERLTSADVDAALGDFDAVWEALSPRERARVVDLLVARVEFDAADSSITIDFHPAGIRTLAERHAGDAA